MASLSVLFIVTTTLVRRRSVDASWTTTILAPPLAPSSSQAYCNVTSFGHLVCGAGGLTGPVFELRSKRKAICLFTSTTIAGQVRSVCPETHEIQLRCISLSPINIFKHPFNRCDRSCGENCSVTRLSREKHSSGQQHRVALRNQDQSSHSAACNS